jgi:phospholipase C
VIYCEPFYNDFATVFGKHGTCNHAPLPVCFGEGLLKRIYEALTSNPAKWARTVLISCYDEHGGFFDHVPPPPLSHPPPDDAVWENRTPFATLGVRIPALVISPWVERGSVYKGLLDHTSILQLMVDRFGEPGDLSTFGQAGARRAAGIQSLADVLTRTTPRLDTLTTLPTPPGPTGAPVQGPRSETSKMFEAVMAAAPALHD